MRVGRGLTCPRAIPSSPSVTHHVGISKVAELIGEALTLRAEKKVEVLVPQRGEKREIMERALTNAREQLGRRMAENSAQRQLLDGVAEAFALDAPPRRIEVYDNSHISGSNAVGAMVVAGPEGFRKNQYRKFNIRSTDITPGDDFGMMREVLTRRFSRLVKEVISLGGNISGLVPPTVETRLRDRISQHK